MDIFEQCTIEASITPDQGYEGDTLVATGSPFSRAYDTLITVGGERAEITSVDRSQCTKCDTCRADKGCGGCKSACADCIETITFVLPEAAAGETTLRVSNAFGSTEAIPFTVLTADTGSTDTSDTGPPDPSDTATDTSP